MDPVTIATTVISVIQVADRVIGLCKAYLEAVRDAPSDLRVILIEISTTRVVLDSLHFLISCSHGPTVLDSLAGDDGPIEGCRRSISEIEGLFPSNNSPGAPGAKSKRRKIQATLAGLAWPFKETKARKLLAEMIQFKTTISLALTTEST